MRRSTFLGALAASCLTCTSSWAGEDATPFRGPHLVLGRVEAAQTLSIYLSTTCSHCAAFAREVLPELESELVATGKVSLIIEELPTAPIAASSAGFLLARCAGPAAYWPAVRSLLERQDEVLAAGSTAAAVARQVAILGLDPLKAETCLSDVAAIDALNDRRQAALNRGVDATPTFFIDGRRLDAGVRLAGEVYEGGELTYPQLLDALSKAKTKGLER